MKPIKTALVTGGSGGIGSEICKQLALAGYVVIVNYNSNKENALKTLHSLKNSEQHHIFKASITNSNELSDMANFVKTTFGFLDVLVNNSGVTKAVPHENLDDLEDDFIDQIMKVNFRGTFATIRAFRSLLEKGKNPIAINISSIAAKTAVGSNVAYCASKAAVDSLTMSLGRALAPKIRVVSLSPGWVNGAYAKNLPKEYIKEQEDKTPLGRIAEAEDIGKALVAIAESFTFSTGCIFPVDGGRPLT
ncbi:SDR family NAD(P)-dependent oxidoreductase [Polaribacter sp. NJDZ03]|uniref:SDR family NAD(P)-dependent oxidoreductase n=1 Tax=Polaribacter sp. NJDZ03 TaxID=2855841 RepID=UPI001C4A2183|nr:SDR family oxidoreductase [Polaribacter sp. NJDZ03]